MSQVSMMPLQRQVSPTMAVIPAILVPAELLVAIATLSSLPHRSHITVFINFLKGKVTGPPYRTVRISTDAPQTR